MSVQDEIPRSRLTLKYRTTIDGEPAVVELPLRLMVLGDFGSTKDRALDLDERDLRSIDGNNLPYVMKDMEIEMSLEVKNLVNPEEEDETMAVTIPIDDMRSFSPDAIAKAVPKVQALLLLRSALRALQTNVSNSKAFRRQLQELFLPENADALAKVREELQEFVGLRIPSGQQVIEA
jgi:type VI secretion system protein ImpB